MLTNIIKNSLKICEVFFIVRVIVREQTKLIQIKSILVLLT